MSITGLLRTALAAALLVAPAGFAATADGWELLKSMAGDWAAKTPEGDRTVSYQVISNGSAVMETLRMPNGDPFMVTVYHRDGGALMATHYCAMGNQPRMRAESAQAEGNRLTFKFLDVTNLTGPDAGYISGVVFNFASPTSVTQDWSYREKGKDAKSVFQLTRKTASHH
jgi:hypothetical protein